MIDLNNLPVLLEKYSIQNLVIKKLTKKEQTMRYWIFGYMLPLFVSFCLITLFEPVSFWLALNLGIYFVYFIDLILHNFNCGVFNFYYTKCLKAEMKILKVKDSKKLEEAKKNLQSELIFSEIMKAYPNLNRDETLIIIQEGINNPTPLSKISKFISLILTALIPILWDIVVKKYDTLTPIDLKFFAFYSILFAIFILVIMVILNPFKTIINKRQLAFIKLRELLFISNMK